MEQSGSVWNDIEEKLKSLTSSLQSLPTEMRSKAFEFISKQMNENVNSGKSMLAPIVKMEVYDDSIGDIDGTATSSLAHERQRGSQNIRTSTQRNQTGQVREGVATVDGVDTSVVLSTCIASPSERSSKRRGRPRKSNQISVEADEPNLTAPIQDNSIKGSTDDRQKTDCSSAIRRSNRKVKRRPLSPFDSESESITGTDLNKKLTDGQKSSSIGTSENRWNKMKGVSDDDISNNECDAIDVLFNDINRTQDKLCTQSEVLESEDICSQLASKKLELVPHYVPKKRGRPSKAELMKRASDPLYKLPREKKPTGRPPITSYQNGYVAKPKMFTCTHCGKKLASKQSLGEHLRHHTGECYICDLCGANFFNNSSFLLHKKYHLGDSAKGIFNCHICRYSVSSQQLLDSHYKSRHDPKRPKPHICDVCGKGFYTSNRLEIHLLSHSDKKPYVCDECDFSTAYRTGIKKHKYNVHESSGQRKIYECELCNAKLRSKGTYEEHLGRHFNQRKKKCEQCDKTFPTSSQLATHRRTHTDPKTQCNLCGKLFRNKHKLAIHLLVHSGQKDLCCPVCPYVTYVRHNLKKHCLARHKIDYPPVLHPSLKKFNNVEKEAVTAMLRDPVARQAIDRMEFAMAECSGLENRSEECDAVASDESEKLGTDMSGPNVSTIDSSELHLISSGKDVVDGSGNGVGVISSSASAIDHMSTIVALSVQPSEQLVSSSGEIKKTLNPDMLNLTELHQPETSLHIASGLNSTVQTVVPIYSVPMFLLPTELGSGDDKTVVTVTALNCPTALNNQSQTMLVTRAFSAF